MAFPVVSNNSLMSVIWEVAVDNQSTMLTHCYRIEIPSGSPQPLNVVMTAFDTKMRDAIEGIDTLVMGCYSQQALGGVRHQQVIFSTRYIKFDFVTEPTVGQVAEDSMPPNVAAGITIRSYTAGRDRRCVKHIGCMPLSWSANGFITGGGPANYGLLASGLCRVFVIDVGGTVHNFQPVIYHREAPAASADAVVYSVSPTSRVERRRTVGLGT